MSLVAELIDWDVETPEKAYKDLDGYRIVDAHSRVCIYPLVGDEVGACIAYARIAFDGWWEIIETSPRGSDRIGEAETIERVIELVKTWSAR